VIDVPLILIPVDAIRTKILAIGLRLRTADAVLFVVSRKLGLVAINVALVRVAVHAVLV